MSTLTLPDIPLTADSAAQRLRRTAAAVRLHFTWWGVHRSLTPQQKQSVGAAHAADARFLTAGKKLVDVRHPAFRRLTSLRTQVGNYWRGLTLPYPEPGLRLIRQADIAAFVHTLEGFRAELVQAEADLHAVYADLQADARQRLGQLYQAGDYPPAIRGLFDLAWDFPSVEPPSYLLRLEPALYAQEQARVAARFEEAVQRAEQAFLGEFAHLVAHLGERLSGGAEGERKVFRDSALSNLTAFFQRFRALNVGGQEQLEALVAQAEQLVQGVAPRELRDQEALRQHLASQFAGMQQALDGLLVNRPRRQILRTTPSHNGAPHAPGD
jgi:hypothetical protein